MPDSLHSPPTHTHTQLVARKHRQGEQQVTRVKSTATSVEIKYRQTRLANFCKPILLTETRHLSHLRQFAKTKRRIEH